ncbi:hypothetical protein NSIN_20585 [Nitrosotalea sinensis]|uniref:Uncharacterized protein n=1 Tax=Nitrosotalea sinensis TaxID=1499975 RepID=A0A2H1EGB5_9ARCH|nr:hypothetical protein NSIN_20585 [Candidatus Nitrosotalea sinensis]
MRLYFLEFSTPELFKINSHDITKIVQIYSESEYVQLHLRNLNIPSGNFRNKCYKWNCYKDNFCGSCNIEYKINVITYMKLHVRF